MKHKKSGIFKRTAISVMAVACALSSATALSANAASLTVDNTLPNSGYVVSTKASYSGTVAKATGTVTSGPPVSMKIDTYGFYGTKAELSCKHTYKKTAAGDVKTTWSCTADPSKTIIGCIAKIKYNAEKAYTVKCGTYDVSVVS